MGLINNDGKDLSFKEVFEKYFKQRFDKIIKLVDETNFDDLICYFKNISNRRRFDDFDNGKKFFEKSKSVGMKLE